MLKPKSETRCFWFEDDGTPIRKAGCPNGSLCRFAHPSDENWDRLPRQVNRPIGYGSRNWRDSTRRDDYRERDSPPRSRYRSPSRSRSPHSHRRSEKRRISRSTARSRSADKMDVDYPRKDNNDSGTLRSGQAAGADRNMSSSTSKSTLMVQVTSTSSSSPLPTSTTAKERLPPNAPSAIRTALETLPKKASDPPASVSTTSPSLGQQVRSDEQVPALRVDTVRSPSMDLSSGLASVQFNPAPPTAPPPSQPPPPPASSIQPPYPLPEIPDGLTLKISPPVAEPSPAERRKIWEERIKLFADTYQAKRELERCEQMYKYSTDISQSNFFSTFSEEDLARYNADLAELIINRDKAKKVHEGALDRLIEQGSWPLGPPPATKSDELEERERHDIFRHVQELNSTAQKMSNILGDIAMQTKPPTLPLPGDDHDDIYEEEPMDVNDDAPATPPTPDADLSGSRSKRKRRQLLEDDRGAKGRAVDPDLPTREELEDYRNRLEKLGEKIMELDDELSRYEDEMKTSFEYEVEKRIEEYDVARRQREKEKTEKEKAIREEEMNRVNSNAEDLENDVKEIGTEVADVMAKIEVLKIQLLEEKKQREIMQVKVVQVNDRLQSYIRQRESNVRTMETLEAALKAYLSSLSQPSPPSTPSDEAVAPTSAYILSQLEEPILQVIRQHIQPMLAQSRVDTETLVREKNTELVKKIWPRMESVSKLLVVVADKLDEENMPTSPAAHAPTYPIPPVDTQLTQQQTAPTPADLPPSAGFNFLTLFSRG